jgi:PII-like signaling protein
MNASQGASQEAVNSTTIPHSKDTCPTLDTFAMGVQGYTGVYRGIQGYKHDGIQGYTGVYRGIQGCKHDGIQGYTRGIQGYTGVYRGIQGVYRGTEVQP